MKKIENQELMEKYLKKHRIREYFSTPELPFQLYRLEKGEYLNNELDPKDYFSFIVEGAYQIINVDDSGKTQSFPVSEGFNCLGDLEFAIGEYSPYLIEIRRTSWFITLPLNDARSLLENDPLLLRFITRQLGMKVKRSQNLLLEGGNHEERLLYYIRSVCTDGTFSGVEKAAAYVRVSRRQLQRILHKFIEQGILEKTGKGTYRLLQK